MTIYHLGSCLKLAHSNRVKTIITAVSRATQAITFQIAIPDVEIKVERYYFCKK